MGRASEAECQGAEKWVEVLQLLPRMPGVEITMVGPEVPEELDGENHELSFEDSNDNASSSGAGGAGGAGEEEEGQQHAPGRMCLERMRVYGNPALDPAHPAACALSTLAQLAQLLAFQLPSWWFHCGAAGADALV